MNWAWQLDPGIEVVDKLIVFVCWRLMATMIRSYPTFSVAFIERRYKVDVYL